MALFQYAGVGSRSTPSLALHAIPDLASHLQVMGFTCRSGGAAGADTAFATGAHPAIISILPWEGYRTQAPGEKVYLAPNDSDAQASVDRFHPAPHRLSRGARTLMARNYRQVATVDGPVDFLVCWTPQGTGSGGTGQAIRIASHLHVPVFDLGKDIELAQDVLDYARTLCYQDCT